MPVVNLGKFTVNHTKKDSSPSWSKWVAGGWRQEQLVQKEQKAWHLRVQEAPNCTLTVDLTAKLTIHTPVLTLIGLHVGRV